MGVCDECGNEYDEAFEVRLQGQPESFDSLACALEAMTPRCAHCDARVEEPAASWGDRVYCSPNCAERGRASRWNA